MWIFKLISGFFVTLQHSRHSAESCQSSMMGQRCAAIVALLSNKCQRPRYYNFTRFLEPPPKHGPNSRIPNQTSVCFKTVVEIGPSSSATAAQPLSHGRVGNCSRCRHQLVACLCVLCIMPLPDSATFSSGIQGTLHIINFRKSDLTTCPAPLPRPCSPAPSTPSP